MGFVTRTGTKELNLRLPKDTPDSPPITTPESTTDETERTSVTGGDLISVVLELVVKNDGFFRGDVIPQ